MASHSENLPELPASPGRIVFFAVLALVAGVAVSWWVDRPPGPVCSGYLRTRSTLIHARHDCTVASLVAEEGASVRIGDPLVTLEDEHLLEQMNARTREIASLESELARVQAQANLEIEWRMRTLESEICELQLKSANYLKEKYDFDMQRTMLTEVLTGSKSTAANDVTPELKQVALENGSAPPQRLSTIVQLEAAANAAEVSAAQLEICGQREQQLKELKKQLPAQIHKTMGVDVAQGDLDRAKADLERLQKREIALAIQSPAIGKVGVYEVQSGDRLKAGDTIVELHDGSRQFLIVHVPSQSVTRFAKGSEVSLRFPGGFSGKGEVTQVAPQTRVMAGIVNDVIVDIQVEPKGILWPSVPIGSQVEVRPAR